MCERYFYRCPCCLTVAAINERISRPLCSVCGDNCDFMGRVHRDRLVKEGMECKCDARCTFARGPSCDCKCGGVNHGQGILVFVRRDAGKVPVLEMQNPHKAKRIADEFRAALQSAKEEIEQLVNLKHARQLTPDEARTKWRIYKAVQAAIQSRSHHHRMKTLRAVLPAPAATISTPEFIDRPAATKQTVLF